MYYHLLINHLTISCLKRRQENSKKYGFLNFFQELILLFHHQALFNFVGQDNVNPTTRKKIIKEILKKN